MNMMWQPWSKAGLVEDDDRLPRFDMVLRIQVNDPGLLWRMAAARALAFGDMDEGGIEDLIGPAQDPSLADCIAMLFGPRDVPGCIFEDFSLSPSPAFAGRALDIAEEN